MGKPNASVEIESAPLESELLPEAYCAAVLEAAFTTAQAAMRLVNTKMLEKAENKREMETERENSLAKLDEMYASLSQLGHNEHALEQALMAFEGLVKNVRDVRNRYAGVEKEEREGAIYEPLQEVWIMALTPPKRGRIVRQTDGFKARPYYQIEVIGADGQFMNRYYDNGSNTVFCYARQLQPYKEETNAA